MRPSVGLETGINNWQHTARAWDVQGIMAAGGLFLVDPNLEDMRAESATGT